MLGGEKGTALRKRVCVFLARRGRREQERQYSLGSPPTKLFNDSTCLDLAVSLRKKEEKQRRGGGQKGSGCEEKALASRGEAFKGTREREHTSA